VLFAESLPPGVRGALQIAAFASIVASAGLLGRPATPRSDSPRTRTGVRRASGYCPNGT
jgi:hypothetical protein